MERLTKTQLFATLSASSDQLHSDEKLSMLFDNFVRRVARLGDRSGNARALLRTLTYTKIKLHSLESTSVEPSALKRRYIEQAIRIVELEMELVYLELKHPERLSKPKKQNQPSMFWSKRFAHIALSELLVGLHLLGAVAAPDGSNVSFTQLVESFERLFRVKLGNPQQIKLRVLSRKLKRTTFTDTLRRALDEYADK